MKKAVIVYNSKKGTTKKYGEEIKNILCDKGVATVITSIQDFSPSQLAEASHIFLGCWTSGLFIFLQHPEKEWINFAEKLPDLKNTPVSFFTTYKLATGSMFRNMAKYLKANKINLQLKSKDGSLSDNDRNSIIDFVNN